MYYFCWIEVEVLNNKTRVKKIQYIYVCFLWLLVHPAVAQDVVSDVKQLNLDSLLNKLNNASAILDKVTLNNDIAQYYVFAEQNGSESYLFDARQLLSEVVVSELSKEDALKFNYELCRRVYLQSYEDFASLNLNNYYERLSRLDSLVSLQIPCANKGYETQYKQWKAESVQNRACIDFVWGNPERALNALEQSIEQCRKDGNSKMEGRGYKKMAEMYSYLNSYVYSAECYETAIEKYSGEKPSAFVAGLYMGLGNQYSTLGEVSKAIDAYTACISKSVSISDNIAVGAAYFNMAQTYYRAKDYEFAARYAKKALEYYSIKDEALAVADCLDILTAVYYYKGDNAALVDCAIETLRIRTDANDREGMLNSNSVLIFAYLSIANNLQEFDSKDYYVHQAHVFSQNTVMASIANISRLKTNNLLSAYMEADDLGESARSFVGNSVSQTLLNAKAKDESHMNQTLKNKLSQFESAAQQRTIEMQRTRIQIGRKRFMLSTFTGFILFMLVVYIFVNARRHRRTSQILAERNAQISEQQGAINLQVEELKSLMGFKERMTNMIIHDLKTPLNGIMSAEYIEDNALRVEIVRHSATEMMNLVQNVLDFYKTQETGMVARLKKVSLSSIIETETRNIRFILDEKMLDLQFEDRNVPKFDADPQLFRRIISNIFSNSAKYSPQGGIIKVTAWVENETDLRLTISNQGPSIPADQVELIFQPFGQVAGGKDLGKASSTGLGLTFCQMAVEAHGGSIGVTPDKTDGAEFWILLPNCISKS